jgi:ubiquinone/menaquinone biosynthesis C-methylase UbiE
MRQHLTSVSLDATEESSGDDRGACGSAPGAMPDQSCPANIRRFATREDRPHQVDNEEQKRVAEHFQQTAVEWRDLYYKHDLYALLYQERKSVVLSLVDRLGVTPEARALDIGCGPGLISLALAERGYGVDAIDIAPAMINMTRQLLGEAGLGRRVRAIEGDVRNLKFPDNSFDVVLAVGVTEWLPSLQQPMSEIARVLRPGGYAIITSDNSWNVHSIFDPMYNPVFSPVRKMIRRTLHSLRGIPLEPRHYERSVQELDSSLRRSRLAKIKRVTLGFGPLRLFGRKLCSESTAIKIHRKLQILADRNWPIVRSTGRIYIAVAQKPAKDLDHRRQ